MKTLGRTTQSLQKDLLVYNPDSVPLPSLNRLLLPRSNFVTILVSVPQHFTVPLESLGTRGDIRVDFSLPLYVCPEPSPLRPSKWFLGHRDPGILDTLPKPFTYYTILSQHFSDESTVSPPTLPPFGLTSTSTPVLFPELVTFFTPISPPHSSYL